jgi:hypothetical protein
MTSKRITPLLLAASVFLTGASGAFIGAMTPAHAITSVDELSDVNRTHWAYEALRDLVEKYDVIEGYPDKTFRGARYATRWEMAAALNALIKSVGRDLARLGAEKANKSDLEAVARLQEEFKNELAALNARTSALEERASAIEAKNEEQDNRLTLLEKTQLHGDMTFGALADIAPNGTGEGDDGILDTLSAVGRLRLTLDVPVKEDRDDSLVGRGDVHARLVAAFGRQAPFGAQGGNLGGFNPYTGYSRIAGDASGFNEGVNTSNLTPGLNGAGGNTRANLYVENVHYKQHFKSGIPLLTDWSFGTNTNDDWKATGDLYIGIVPWRYLYDKSPYRGNELTQFQNTAFVNTPGVAVNYNMPMVAYQWHQGLGANANLDLTAGVGSINVGNVYDGFTANYEARLNYNTRTLLGLGDGDAMPGSLYVGGYNIWQFGPSALTPVIAGTTNRAGAAIPNLSEGGSANAFYAGWNQDWYKGIGTNVSYLLADKNNSSLVYNSLQNPLGANAARVNENRAVAARQALSGVLNIPIAALLPGVRDNDTFGVGYAFVDLQEYGISGEEFGDAFEQVVEAYYRWQVNDSVSIVPSVQLIFNRLGLQKNDVDTIIGLRTNFTF